MQILPYDAFSQLANLRKEFDHFFSDFPTNLGTTNHLGAIKVDVYEQEKEVIATCDIPGLERQEDVNIHIRNSTLNISGTIKKAVNLDEGSYYRKERLIGRFQRSVSLPCPVSSEGIKATYKNGVLEVRMPKLMKDSEKKIDVEFH